ncbi:OB-fold nucleic acid binding domain-containing protein [Intrasporangium calvum]|uniref:OB-fold nucleic acid binding domain-containing protein n=1 Tax=Intrasporangium calvum TaxID=53358 RepID=A0ABT5GLG0_9MICO|nr:OB-fold nucleic acid binding domain-containing protein [Intrasporangium calvum]MDC5699052.1 OB-fold nucleic acid binding domain-containing protein [Intrasporangium calvum]
MTSEAGSRLRRFASRLRPAAAGAGQGGPPAEPDVEPGPADVVQIGQARPRQRVTVVGEVRILALRPQGDVPTLDVELWDGSDALHLVWLGRRSIPGISTGTRLRATGRVTLQRRAKTIFNPAYEVIGTARGPHG